MKKQISITNASALFTGIAAMCCVPEGIRAAEKNDSRPNVILIMSDQQTASAMSCVGNAYVNTPALDALASDGVIFNRAYCPYPLSNPCRASLVTGYMPWQTGVTDNGVAMKQEYMDKNIGHVMTNAGYESLYAGKWHIPEIDVPDNVGFTKIIGMDDLNLVNACKPYLEKKYDKPLFLVASFLNPHEICEYARQETLPYGPIGDFRLEDTPNLPANFMPSTYEPEAVRQHYKSMPKVYASYDYTQDDWRRYMYAYYRLVERVDKEIGRLVELLKQNGLYDNSVIIFTSDHGDGVASHQWNQKWALFEETINVPLIIKAPKNKSVKGNRKSEALTNIGLDFFVTACDYAGVELDETYKGRSLRPLAEGKSKFDSLHDAVFVETLLSGVSTRGWTIVSDKYKYVLYNWFRNREQLYDLENDPGEMVNLAVDKRYNEIVQEMREKMYEWGQHINDWRLIKALKPIVEK